MFTIKKIKNLTLIAAAAMFLLLFGNNMRSYAQSCYYLFEVSGI